MIEPSDGKLKRDIAFWSTGFLILNSVIGAGIFALPEKMHTAAGSFSPWLFPIIGLFMMTIVMSFARLASFFRLTGGPVLYAYTAFGPMAGFQAGWLLFFARVLAFAANANVMVTYASYLWEPMAQGAYRAMAIFLICFTLMVTNLIGIKQAVRALNTLTFLKMLPILIIVALGLPMVSSDLLIPSSPPEFSAIEGSLLVLMYAFVGFEAAIVNAGEMKNPRRNLPRALIFTIAAITVIYTLIQFVYSANITDGVEAQAPLIALGQILMGDTGAIMITLAAVFSIGGNLITSMMSAPRMSYAMAKEKTLPAWFGHVSEKYATPSNSIVFYTVLTAILAVSGKFVWLAAMSSVARMLVYGLCIAAMPRIEREADEETRAQALKLPFGPLLPIVGLVFSLWAAAQSTLEGWALLGVMVLAGACLFFAARNKENKVSK